MNIKIKENRKVLKIQKTCKIQKMYKMEIMCEIQNWEFDPIKFFFVRNLYFNFIIYVGFKKDWSCD